MVAIVVAILSHILFDSAVVFISVVEAWSREWAVVVLAAQLQGFFNSSMLAV